MIRKFREHAQSEKGFTLIELLVVILIIGILAAIAIPSFLNQRAKGNDAEAKSNATTAAQAMETCATDNNGQYTTCNAAAILGIEPTLNNATALSVSGTASSYVVSTQSKRSTSVVFTYSKASNGTTTRTCVTGTQDRGGCSAATGTW